MNESKDYFDYTKYMTIEALDDLVTITFPRNIEYGIDGVGWKEATKIIASKNQFISVRCVLEEGQEFSVEAKGISIYGKCRLRGNALSLIFGDSASGITDISAYNSVFAYLFKGCDSIQEVEENFLPATTLADNCYYSMFIACTSLVNAPALPATTLARDCYNNMFWDCTSLTTAPELPATTLTYNCYNSMFNGCTSLTTAPELPATTLAEHCYSRMFDGCGKLNYIKMLATDISATDCLYHWVNSVASTGTFVKNAAMTSLPTGVSGIPSGWTVQNA